MTIDDRLKIKFVIMKLREISNTNQYGKRMVNNIDHVIFDIFGVKDFTKKIQNSIDDRDIFVLFNRVGIKNMMEICDSSTYFNIFTKMVEIDYAILYTKRMLRKRKKKNSKKLSDDLKGMEKIYRRALKKIKRRFGIKSSNEAYKNRFKTLIDFTEDDDLYDDELASIYFDDDDFYGDGWDDDWDNDSEYQRFANSYYSKHNIRRTPERKRRPSSDLLDFDPELDDDDYDPLYGDESGTKDSDNIERLENIMSQMATQISNLTNHVSKISVQNSSIPSNQIPPVTLERVPGQRTNSVYSDSNSEINQRLMEIAKKQDIQNKVLVDTIKKQQEQQQTQQMILEFLTAEDVDNDDIPDSEAYMEDILKYPDVTVEATYDDIPSPSPKPLSDSDGITRDQLIDLINHGE